MPLAATAPAYPPWTDQVFGDAVLRLCAAASVLLLCLPADGIPGVELCYFHAWTGLPCPGCGLTRSGSNLLRGHVGRALAYNPFGLCIVPAVVALGVVGLAPLPWRQAVRRGLARRRRELGAIFLVVSLALVLFGVIRGFLVWQGRMEFPTVWM